jgi:hypothetical protein
VKLNAARLAWIHVQHMAQMPRNRFPFAVRVSCEVNLRRGACLFADAVEDFTAPADRDVLKGKGSE